MLSFSQFYVYQWMFILDAAEVNDDHLDTEPSVPVPVSGAVNTLQTVSPPTDPDAERAGDESFSRVVADATKQNASALLVMDWKSLPRFHPFLERLTSKDVFMQQPMSDADSCVLVWFSCRATVTFFSLIFLPNRRERTGLFLRVDALVLVHSLR